MSAPFLLIITYFQGTVVVVIAW